VTKKVILQSKGYVYKLKIPYLNKGLGALFRSGIELAYQQSAHRFVLHSIPYKGFMLSSDNEMRGLENRKASLLSRKVEAFALDLSRLIRGVYVYPAKHPTLLGVARNVLDSAPLDATGHLTIGVTSRELVVLGEFVAGKATKLASMLHARKVLQLFWSKDATLDDVWTFARVMATPKIEGHELQQRLRSEIPTVDIEPLKLDQIHSQITDMVKGPGENLERRRRNAWLALMTHEAPTEQLASALASEEFWEVAKAEWTELGYGDSEGFASFLLTLGERLEDALALLPNRQREDILNYLTQMGKCLAVGDLVRIVGREGHESRRLGLGKASLLREIDAERFVHLLAGLAALGDQGTRRFLEVYRRFAPVSQTDNLLSLVRSRLSSGKDSEFATEVWKTVETLILNQTENSFMDGEYSESLEFLTGSSVSMSPGENIPVLSEDPDDYLDQLILALTEQLGPLRVLGFVRLVDQTLPGLLDSYPFLVKDLFQKGLSALTKTSIGERQALIAFAANHERCLLDTALKALAEETQISTRQFLVNLLSCFSSAATPTFVVKSRTSPWYVARNLAIVLGRQGFPQVLPPLRALSNHTHPKVKREALKALKRVQSSLCNSECEERRKKATVLQDSGKN
jgi:hypothetical protein